MESQTSQYNLSLLRIHSVRIVTSWFAVEISRNLLVNLGLFAAGVWVARNLSDFDLMSPQPIT